MISHHNEAREARSASLFFFLLVFQWEKKALHNGVMRACRVTCFFNYYHLCCIAHKKKIKKPILRTNSRLEAPLPPFFSCWAFLNSALSSSCRVDPEVLHPATHSLAHSLQCGKAAAVFVPSTSMDFAAQVRKFGSIGWICTIGQVILLKKNELVRVFFSCEYSYIQQKINYSVFDHNSFIF